jgi:acetyl esterase
MPRLPYPDALFWRFGLPCKRIEMTSVAKRTFRFLVHAIVVLLALGALGALLPWIPVLGELGPILIATLGPWVAILPLIGGVLIFRRARKTGKRHRALLALAAFAAIASGVMLARQVAIAHENGVKIDPLQTLLLHPQGDDHLRPTTVSYASYAGQAVPLDVYPLPVNHVGTSPVLVYIHGGGWGAETLKQRQADYRWFAERGYLVISLEYSLSSETQHTWNVAQPQLGCALAWVGANAARFGGDASRLALWGESAGGNLVLNLSYAANQGTLKPPCAGTVPRVTAVMALYPVVDPAHMYRNTNPLISFFGRMMTVNYTGGTPGQFPDRYAAIASASYINAAAPPTLLVVPEEDHLVDPQAAYGFAAKAQAAGVPVDVIRMPYAEHAFDMTSGSIGNQLVRQAMLRFLLQHGLKP